MIIYHQTQFHLYLRQFQEIPFFYQITYYDVKYGNSALA